MIFLYFLAASSIPSDHVILYLNAVQQFYQLDYSNELTRLNLTIIESIPHEPIKIYQLHYPNFETLRNNFYVVEHRYGLSFHKISAKGSKYDQNVIPLQSKIRVNYNLKDQQETLFFEMNFKDVTIRWKNLKIENPSMELKEVIPSIETLERIFLKRYTFQNFLPLVPKELRCELLLGPKKVIKKKKDDQ